MKFQLTNNILKNCENPKPNAWGMKRYSAIKRQNAIKPYTEEGRRVEKEEKKSPRH